MDKIITVRLTSINLHHKDEVCQRLFSGGSLYADACRVYDGHYPGRTTVGLMEPLIASKEDLQVGLTPAVPSLALRMKSAGYTTALIGKWHLRTS